MIELKKNQCTISMLSTPANGSAEPVSLINNGLKQSNFKIWAYLFVKVKA